MVAEDDRGVQRFGEPLRDLDRFDLVFSTLEGKVDDTAVRDLKRRAFLAILDEEAEILRCDEALIDQIRTEVLARMI